ncbi:MAG TPA: hypothetical protein VJO35_03465 [Terriglobales bacterium]|nr:hypothetical protein [Terriglobales bacterium]
MRTSLKFFVPVLSFATALLFSTPVSAQTHLHSNGGIAPRGVPASVTSFGFGGHPGFHGVPASVTSQAFGRNFVRGVPGSVRLNGFGRDFRLHERPFRFERRHRLRFFSPFYGGYVAYPYPYYADDDYYPAEEPAAYDPRPTREDDDRQLLNEDYRAELSSARQQQPEAKPAPEPIADQPNTVLIFKDGHQVEVANYAIVGATLYELNDGRSIRVQIADLDLPATVKENDQRGVEFQLPAGTQLN